jgi:glycerol uptake facilitator-like aquaporin
MADLSAQLVAELLGSFVFLLAVFCVGQPIPVAVGLLAAVYVFASVSGAHFNGTISVVKFLANEITSTQLAGYLLAQLVGGLAAYYVSKTVVGK